MYIPLTSDLDYDVIGSSVRAGGGRGNLKQGHRVRYYTEWLTYSVAGLCLGIEHVCDDHQRFWWINVSNLLNTIISRFLLWRYERYILVTKYVWVAMLCDACKYWNLDRFPLRIDRSHRASISLGIVELLLNQFIFTQWCVIVRYYSIKSDIQLTWEWSVNESILTHYNLQMSSMS